MAGVGDPPGGEAPVLEPEGVEKKKETGSQSRKSGGENNWGLT